jgi:serine/threonine-protein kinase
MSGIPTTIGRYQVVSRIAKGGMGTLYLGWDPKLDRQIAIKILLDDNDELRERFAREARSVASLHHLHIVTIFDVGEYEGHPFIAMEYMRGETLQALIRARLVLSIARKLEILEQLCEGLAFAHRAGIIHRDVKPANMILQLDGSLKILDFGIARIAKSSGMTHAGMLIGTLNYMSPEQVSGQVADNRSDVFAVGAVMYELLSYRQAFPGGIEDGILYRLMNESPAPLEDACPGLDPEIFRIVSRALEKDPRKRYPDLKLMANDLRHIRCVCRPATTMSSSAFWATRWPRSPARGRRSPRRRASTARSSTAAARARSTTTWTRHNRHCRTETTRRGFPRASKR